jgi:hypothetical protein
MRSAALTCSIRTWRPMRQETVNKSRWHRQELVNVVRSFIFASYRIFFLMERAELLDYMH